MSKVALKFMEEPPDTNRQVLVWTHYFIWFLAYYDHRWLLSDEEDSSKLTLCDAIGWCECPEVIFVDAGLEDLAAN